MNLMNQQSGIGSGWKMSFMTIREYIAGSAVTNHESRGRASPVTETFPLPVRCNLGFCVLRWTKVGNFRQDIIILMCCSFTCLEYTQTTKCSVSTCKGCTSARWSPLKQLSLLPQGQGTCSRHCRPAPGSMPKLVFQNLRLHKLQIFPWSFS